MLISLVEIGLLVWFCCCCSSCCFVLYHEVSFSTNHTSPAHNTKLPNPSILIKNAFLALIKQKNKNRSNLRMKRLCSHSPGRCMLRSFQTECMFSIMNWLCSRGWCMIECRWLLSPRRSIRKTKIVCIGQ